MDKVIVTALLTMAAVVAAVMVINAVVPSLGRSSSSVLSSSDAAADIIKTDIEIVATDTTPTPKEVYVWIKNVGAANVLAIDKGDVFLEEVNVAFARLTHDSGQDGLCNYVPPAGSWAYCIEDSETTWKPNTTVKITIARTALATNSYEVEFITSNGVSDKEFFSV